MDQFWMLFSICFVFYLLLPAAADVTFGSCPNKCQCDPDEDGKMVIDCTGAGYDYIPVTSIPCDTRKLLFINNNLQLVFFINVFNKKA